MVTFVCTGLHFKYRQADKQAGRQAGRQTGRQTERQTERRQTQRERYNRQTNKHICPNGFSQVLSGGWKINRYTIIIKSHPFSVLKLTRSVWPLHRVGQVRGRRGALWRGCFVVRSPLLTGEGSPWSQGAGEGGVLWASMHVQL